METLKSIQLKSPKKLYLFFILLFVSSIVDFKPIYSMNQPNCQIYPSRDVVASEVNNLVTSTPTGFTFLVRSCKSKLYNLITISWRMVRHPISSTMTVCSKVSGSALSIASSGAKKGLQVALHPVETTKMVISITVNPIKSVSQFISFCDNIVVDDLPLIGDVSQGWKQFSGLIKISQDNCPNLYRILEAAAGVLGYDNAKRIYVFKGNFITNILENANLYDSSCDAFQSGLTRGSEYICMGKDLFLGVNNPLQGSYVHGMQPEQIQALFAREASHCKFRHALKGFTINASIAIILARLFFTNFNEAIRYNVMTMINPYSEYQTLTINGTALNICVEALYYKILKSWIAPLITQGLNREFDLQADMSAHHALDNSRTVIAALNQFFYISDHKRRLLAELFQNHPDLGTRIGHLEDKIKQQIQSK